MLRPKTRAIARKAVIKRREERLEEAGVDTKGADSAHLYCFEEDGKTVDRPTHEELFYLNAVHGKDNLDKAVEQILE